MTESPLHLKHILVQHKYEAEDLQRKLEEGLEFSELAKKFSKCPSAKQGGDLGVIALSRLVKEFADAARELKVQEISGVVKTSFGYHLIQRV